MERTSRTNESGEDVAASAAAPEDAPPSSLPRHLAPLPGGAWGAWRWFGLRGGGFAVDGVRRLAAPASAEAADRLLAAEEHRDTQRRRTIDSLSDGLYELGGKERFRRFRVLERLNKGRVPRPRDVLDGPTRAFVDTQKTVEEARVRFDETFAADLVAVAGRLREVAADDRFRMAVAWQNRSAVESGLDTLVASPVDGTRNSAERRIEQMVASYLQRYCTKNDTIGWFGPIGWGRLRPAGEAIRVEPGDRLVAERYLRFETWCVDEVAAALLGDDNLRRWWVPRTWPFFVLQGDAYYPLVSPPVRLEREELAILRACDGRRTAAALATALAAEPGLAFAGESDVLDRLGALAARAIVLWRAELPMVRRPEQVLWRLVDGIDDPGLREPRRARLAELEAHRDAIAEAADADSLVRSLAALESWFSDLTGHRPTRLGGRMYAGRTLIHEDCRRDLTLEVGSELLQALGPPLDLVLRSARWFTHELSRRWTVELADLYRALRREGGGRPVLLFELARALQPMLLDGDGGTVAGVVAALQRRWLQLLEIGEGERRVERTSASLRARGEKAFDAPGPGWIHARIHSPDVMIAAESVKAIRAGDFLFVLGEVHAATNTLRARLVCEAHPNRSELQDAVSWDIPEPTVVPWMPRTPTHQGSAPAVGVDLPTTSARLDLDLLSAKDLRLAVNLEPPGDPEAETVRLGDFFVTEGEGGLRVRSFDRRHDLGLMDFLALAFTVRAVESFQLLPARRYSPRVTIDRLVIQRETWRLSAGELGLAERGTEADRFLEARQLARKHRMPRSVFVLSPYETKPFYVDFDSPPAVEILCRAVRGAIERGGPDTELRFSEMLPSLEQCWLTDADGNRFTSELRMAVVDLSLGGANTGHAGIRGLGNSSDGARG